jgi:predicted transcriptional regulator of viral defense system
MNNYLFIQNLRENVLVRISGHQNRVWTPGDFADLAGRDAIDKTLQRLAKSGDLRRIARGLYDLPSINSLTGRQTVPDYRAVIDAVARRDQARFVIDGMTAANQLGLTTAVPAKIEVLVDSRLGPISLGAQKIIFKQAAPSRLYWAGRPAMAVVQALHWLKDVMDNPDERTMVEDKMQKHFQSKKNGNQLMDDLRDGLSALPIWMQEFLRKLLAKTMLSKLP